MIQLAQQHLPLKLLPPASQRLSLLNVSQFEASKFCPSCIDIKVFRYFYDSSRQVQQFAVKRINTCKPDMFTPCVHVKMEVLSKQTISFDMRRLSDRFPKVGRQCKLLHIHIFLHVVFNLVSLRPTLRKFLFSFSIYKRLRPTKLTCSAALTFTFTHFS